MTNRPHLLPCIALSLLPLICSVEVFSQPLDLEETLEQIIQAYGGEDNLRKLDKQIQEWDVVALMGNRHGTDLRRIRVPDQLKVELTYPDKKETRILSGTAGAVIYGGQPVRIAGQPQRDAMRLQLMRLYSPLVLRDRIDALTLTVERDFRVITLFEHGVRVDYLVNTGNWHIEEVVGSLAIQGSEMHFRTEYSDFKIRDGVLVHERENKFAGGVNTAVLQLRRLTLDADVKKTDFMPTEDHAVQPVDEKNETI